MDDCVFCKIISGQIPAAMLVETDKVVSFLDINPVNPGHALVISRRHVRSLIDMDEAEQNEMISVARRVAAALVEATGWPDFNILHNAGRSAGQVIDHAHTHVIPRKSGDGFAFGWRQLRYKQGELEALQAEIKKRL